MKPFAEIINSGQLVPQDFERFRLEKLEERAKRTRNGGLVAAGILGISVIIGALTYNTLIIIFGFILAVVLFFALRGNMRKKFIRTFKEEFLRKMTQAIAPDIQYFPQMMIDKKTFKESQFVRHYNSYAGEDLFTGTYEGLKFSFSQLNVQQKSKNSSTVMFHGTFYVIDTERTFAGRTTCVPDTLENAFGGVGRFLQNLNMFRDSLIKIDDEDFEKHFAVYSTNETEAKQLISPDLMRLLKIFQSRCPKFYFGFSENQIYIGLDNRVDIFPVNFNEQISEATAERHYDELAEHLSILKQVNDAIFRLSRFS